MAKNTTTKEATDLKRCECGCGVVVNKRFAMGHDAKHKGALLRAFDGGDSEAGDELVERGWRSANELQERRDKADAKAEAKTAREATKDAKASTDEDPAPEQPRVAGSRKRTRNRQPLAHVGNAAVS